MPKSNPKHVKKKVEYQRRKNVIRSKIPLRYWIMGVIFVVVITSVIIVVANLDKLTANNDPDSDLYISEVVDNCWVSMGYRIYYDQNEDGVIDYIGADAEIHDEKTIDRPYTVQVNNYTLIQGWYEGLLGMKKNENKYITIEAFVDEDSDGRNDITGNPPMGYQLGTLAFKKLIIYVVIGQIYSEEEFDPSTVTYYPSETIGMVDSNLSINRPLNLQQADKYLGKQI